VESLVTGKRMPVYSSSKISSLADIAIFTQTGEVALKQVFKNIRDKEKGAEIPAKETADELKAYFAEILPDYDRGRVYTSDMKKIIQWYNLLLKNDLLNLEEEDEDSTNKEAVKE
jgi:hypothetical protein